MATAIFSTPRYATSEIAADLPVELQLLLWGLIDQLPVERDYLQVFYISLTSDGRQQIVHKQIVPPYEATIVCEIIAKRQGNVFVVFDATHASMLWSYQYWAVLDATHPKHLTKTAYPLQSRTEVHQRYSDRRYLPVERRPLRYGAPTSQHLV